MLVQGTCIAFPICTNIHSHFKTARIPCVPEDANRTTVQLSNEFCVFKLRLEENYIAAFFNFREAIPAKHWLKKHFFGEQLKYVSGYRILPQSIQSLGLYLLKPQLQQFHVSFSPGKFLKVIANHCSLNRNLKLELQRTAIHVRNQRDASCFTTASLLSSISHVNVDYDAIPKIILNNRNCQTRIQFATKPLSGKFQIEVIEAGKVELKFTGPFAEFNSGNIAFQSADAKWLTKMAPMLSMNSFQNAQAHTISFTSNHEIWACYVEDWEFAFVKQEEHFILIGCKYTGNEWGEVAQESFRFSELPKHWKSVTVPVRSVHVDAIHEGITEIAIHIFTNVTGRMCWDMVPESMQMLSFGLEDVDAMPSVYKALPYLFENIHWGTVKQYKQCTFVFVVPGKKNEVQELFCNVNPCFQCEYRESTQRELTTCLLKMKRLSNVVDDACDVCYIR